MAAKLCLYQYWIRMQKNIFSVTLAFLLSTASISNAAVYWTVKVDNGIMATSNGAVAINIGGYQPTGANPSGTEWEACKDNWIYFNKKSDGTLVEDKYVDRMLSIALAAYKTDSHIRVAITRSDTNRCYTSQIFDQ